VRVPSFSSHLILSSPTLFYHLSPQTFFFFVFFRSFPSRSHSPVSTRHAPTTLLSLCYSTLLTCLSSARPLHHPCLPIRGVSALSSLTLSLYSLLLLLLLLYSLSVYSLDSCSSVHNPSIHPALFFFFFFFFFPLSLPLPVTVPPLPSLLLPSGFYLFSFLQSPFRFFTHTHSHTLVFYFHSPLSHSSFPFPWPFSFPPSALIHLHPFFPSLPRCLC
jgi:hypothetical protein